jgi:hypothetical protein
MWYIIHKPYAHELKNLAALLLHYTVLHTDGHSDRYGREGVKIIITGFQWMIHSWMPVDWHQNPVTYFGLLMNNVTAGSGCGGVLGPPVG